MLHCTACECSVQGVATRFSGSAPEGEYQHVLEWRCWASSGDGRLLSIAKIMPGMAPKWCPRMVRPNAWRRLVNKYHRFVQKHTRLPLKTRRAMAEWALMAMGKKKENSQEE